MSKRGVDRRRLLPFDLFLSLGHGSVHLFEAGPFDEFAFFQRTGAREQAELEFLTRREVRRTGREEFLPFGVFRLRPAEAIALPDLGKSRGLWQGLRAHGMRSVPGAGSLLRGGGNCYDARISSGGHNRVRATSSSGVFRRPARRPLPLTKVLSVLRESLHGVERVAWIETAFRSPPSEVVHRYYLDDELRAYLVRHHPREGKQLYQAQTSGGHEAHGLLIYGRRRAA